jgi:hypothetical protein
MFTELMSLKTHLKSRAIGRPIRRYLTSILRLISIPNYRTALMSFVGRLNRRLRDTVWTIKRPRKRHAPEERLRFRESLSLFITFWRCGEKRKT